MGEKKSESPTWCSGVKENEESEEWLVKYPK